MSKIKQAIGIMLFESDDFGGPKIVGGGICPTQRANKTCCGVIEVMETEQKIGNIFGFTGGNYAGNVYDKDHLSPTLNTMQGGCKQPMIIDEPKCLNSKGGRRSVEGLQPSLQDRVYSADAVSTAITTSFMPNILEDKTIVAMRGRNPTNPSDRTPGIELEQTLEVNQNGTTNCLTSVQKDNLVMENLIIGGEQKHQSVKKDGICTCLTSSMGTGGGYVPMIAPQYRIRKLTPRECWRLMDFSDEDFEKAAEVNSNTQLYKQAGNSIICNVLVAILGQLIEGKEDAYREV